MIIFRKGEHLVIIFPGADTRNRTSGIHLFFNDKKEKEPIGLQIGLFFAGIGSIIPAIIGEAIGQAVLNVVIPYNSVIKGYIFAILIVGPAEEIGKYLMLRLITWKSKHFNYSYDAIVYAVFVSLGFAAIENVGYVFMNGIGTALLRMFTAVPGHACFAVFMGYFYSKAKQAQASQDKKGIRQVQWTWTLLMVAHRPPRLIRRHHHVCKSLGIGDRHGPWRSPLAGIRDRMMVLPSAASWYSRLPRTTTAS